MTEKMTMAELKNEALSFDDERRDLYARKEAEPDYLCKKHMAVWNMQKARLCCIAPKNYAVITHRDAVHAVVEAITALNISAEGKVKTDRDKVTVDINFPEHKVELSTVGETFTSGIRVVSDYSQVAGPVIAPRVERLVCKNGMIVTDIIKAQRIRFSEELAITLEGIIDTIVKDVISSDERLANMVSVCMRDSVEWTTLKLLLQSVFKTKKHAKEILGRMDRNKARPTRWDVYNAVTNYATFGQRLRPHVEAWLQNKAQGILQTNFQELCTAEVRIEPQRSGA